MEIKTKFDFEDKVFFIDESCAVRKGTVKEIYINGKPAISSVSYSIYPNSYVPKGESELFTSLEEIMLFAQKRLTSTFEAANAEKGEEDGV